MVSEDTVALNRLTDAGGNLASLLWALVDTARRAAGAAEAVLLFTVPLWQEYSLRIRPGEDRPEDQPALNMTSYAAAAVALTGQTVAEDLEIFVPVPGEAAPVGVLGVIRTPETPPFPAHTSDVLATLVTSIGLALRVGGSAPNEASTYAAEFSLLAEAIQAVSWPLDVGSVLNAIARFLMNALDVQWCILTGLDAAEGVYRKLAEHRVAVWQPGAGPVLDLAHHPCRVGLSDTSANLHTVQTNMQQAQPAEQSHLSQAGISRMMAIPIRQGGDVIGLAEVASVHNRAPFTTNEVSRAIHATLSMPPLLSRQMPDNWFERLIDQARALLASANADICSLYYWRPPHAPLYRVLAYGSGLWISEPGPPLAVGTLPTIQIVLNEQRIGLIRSQDPNLVYTERRLFDLIWNGTMLALPLVVKGSTIGLVQLFDTDPERRFAPRELALAQTIASQAAIALENSRLFADLQQSLQEVRAMQSQLVYTARLSALGELSAVVAHQINNPLTTILGDAEMLVQDTPRDQPQYESAVAILRAGQRAKQVVARILSMARVENKQQLLDVNRTIEDTLELVRPQIIQLRITLEADLTPELPPVDAFPGHLEDVWMNLLLNARDAIMQRAESAGAIRVHSALAPDENMITVSITDDGVGVEEQNMGRIFEPLFTTKPRGKGTGLGLYICREIVQEHHGEISFESTPGQGTCVTVRLPAASPILKEA
jgi:signal transduction histidine kinase